MTTPPEGQRPQPGPTPGRWRALWSKYRVWAGGVLTTTVVIPLVGWLAVTAGHKVLNKISPAPPEPHLTAVVQIPSPALVCDGGQGWVFDKSPQQLPGPPAKGGFEAWAAANGGIPASGNYITVTL